MKNIFKLLLLSSTLLFAGFGYHDANIDVYDTQSGLYYKSISKKIEKSGFIISKSSNYQVSNINIYNPKTNQSEMIFKTHNNNITSILFEMGYSEKSIIFNTDYTNTKNNKNIDKRPIKDKLLIVTYDNDKKETTLWTCNKNGKNLKKITIVPNNFNWHIDVKNSKIRVISSTNEQFKLSNFDW